MVPDRADYTCASSGIPGWLGLHTVKKHWRILIGGRGSLRSLRGRAGKDRATRCAEFHILQRRFIILQVAQTPPERTVQQPESELKLVVQREASALATEEEERQRSQMQSELTSILCFWRYVSMCSTVFHC